VALIILDASVLIALLDPSDMLHAAARAAVTRHAGDDLQIPASAYSETLVGPARRGHLAAAKSAIRSLLVEVVPITPLIAERAAELRAGHPGLRLPDALVVATGAELQADTVLTGDARWRQLGTTIAVL
jgi:predicted nucleic acid-binding protein